MGDRDEVGKVSWSPDYRAERAWLDRCSPEYRAVLEKALHADVEALGGGFLDSWQETRLRTEVAVGAFIDAQKREREARGVYVYGGVPEDESEEFSRRMRESEEAIGLTMDRLAGKSDEWVDPCPSWDDIRPYGVTAGSPRDERMRARYEAGRAEYREDWTTWDVARFTEMIQEEEDDATIYRAMRQWVMRGRGVL